MQNEDWPSFIIAKNLQVFIFVAMYALKPLFELNKGNCRKLIVQAVHILANFFVQYAGIMLGRFQVAVSQHL